MMPTSVPLERAEATLRELVERVKHGEDIVVTQGGRPVLRLVKPEDERSPASRQRELGMFKDKIRVHDNFNDPLPEEFLEPGP